VELDGKVAVVTGSGSGIGRAIALRLAGEGARVVIADVAEDIGNESAKIIQASGGKAIFSRCDVTSSKDAESTVGAAVKEFGGLDILVNNAGIEKAGTVVELPEADWDRVMGVNLKGVYLMSRHAVPHLAKRKGVIVNTASVAGFTSYRRCTAYCASKGGVVALTRAMSLDHSPDGIRVNCVCPGAIDTPLHKKYVAALDSSARDDYVRRQVADHPIGRIGRPEEIAEAVLFLASEKSSFMTGAALVVDGGYLAK
jgi:NAD(P)-dependent dehydrogenase (short-subunit alcohol dehydrogenase family)